MINFDNHTNKNNVPHHSYRILTIGGSGSGKTNTLLNLINNQPDTVNTRMICKIFIEILQNTILVKNVKY